MKIIEIINNENVIINMNQNNNENNEIMKWKW